MTSTAFRRRWQRLTAVAAATVATAAVMTAGTAHADTARGPLGVLPGVVDVPGTPGAYGNLLGIPDAGTAEHPSGTQPLTAPVYAVGVQPDSALPTGSVLVGEPVVPRTGPWVAQTPANPALTACLQKAIWPRAVKAARSGTAFVAVPTTTVTDCATDINVATIATEGLIAGLRADDADNWRSLPTDVLVEVQRANVNGRYQYAPADLPVKRVLAAVATQTQTLHDSPDVQAARDAADAAVWQEWALRELAFLDECSAGDAAKRLGECTTRWYSEGWWHQSVVERAAAATNAGDAAAGALPGLPVVPEQAALRHLHDAGLL